MALVVSLLMKLAPLLIAPCLALCLLTSPALAQSETSWLTLLNAETGRDQPLTTADVVFRPAEGEAFPGLVAAGFKQSDGSFTLGRLIWNGKLWSPLEGYAQILKEKGFAEADDATRAQLFYSLLEVTNAPLGVQPYGGSKSREQNRPQPLVGARQVDGQQRFVVWFCKEARLQDGPEWREVVYLIGTDPPTAQARTLGSYQPVAERLEGFPQMPSRASE